MTTLQIELLLMNHFKFNQNTIVPNVTRLSCLVGFETDLLILSKSGYAHGIEIKVSLQDFKKDFNKRHIKTLGDERSFERNFKNLKHFSYAFPEKLLEFAKNNVDERFGIYSIEKHISEYGGYTEVNEVRKPLRLFNTK